MLYAKHRCMYVALSGVNINSPLQKQKLPNSRLQDMYGIEGYSPRTNLLVITQLSTIYSYHCKLLAYGADQGPMLGGSLPSGCIFLTCNARITPGADGPNYA